MSLESFEFIQTGDGTRTLLTGLEPMHNRAGAFGESLYVNRPVIEASLQEPAPRFLVVGLGLGYIEIILSAAMAKAGITTFQIYSFEINQDLKINFKNWVGGGEIPDEFLRVYEEIASKASREFHVSEVEIKNNLMNVELRGDILDSGVWPESINGIFFDPFSSQTSPEIWNETFLTDFLKKVSASHCALSTYSAKGNLKRALQKSNFEVFKRDGYAGKRNCIFAQRGIRNGASQ